MRIEEGGTPMERAREAKREASDWKFWFSFSGVCSEADKGKEGSPVKERVKRPE